MQLGLINSTWTQAGRETAWGIEQTKAIGFDTIDLLVDPLEINIRERCLIRQECQRQELPIISLCCVALGLIDLAPSVQQFHMERVRAHLEMAYDFAARNVLLVLGEYVWQKEVVPPEEQWKWAVHHCRGLAGIAESLGLQIALELEPFRLSLLNDIDTMVRFIDDVDHPALRANIDISHLQLAHVPAPEISRLQGKAIHVHISDCDGKVHGDLPPGRGVVEFIPYLEEVKKLNLAGAISVELEFAPDPEHITEWVTEAYQKTDALLQTVGLRG